MPSRPSQCPATAAALQASLLLAESTRPLYPLLLLLTIFTILPFQAHGMFETRDSLLHESLHAVGELPCEAALQLLTHLQPPLLREPSVCVLLLRLLLDEATALRLRGAAGELLLVSGSLLQTRGSTNGNLAHTNVTLIKFTPEPGSAALIAVGALGLIGLVVHDRRRNRA